MSNFITDLNDDMLKLVNEALEDDEVMTDINQKFAEICDPYVPYITGKLANNITVNSNGITYNQPYAEEVYNSHNLHNKEQHPLATSRWDEVAFANHEEEIGAEVKERIERWIKTNQ